MRFCSLLFPIIICCLVHTCGYSLSSIFRVFLILQRHRAMRENIDSFYLQQEEPTRSCLMVLREIILAYDTTITEAWKYSMPCFCYKGKALCYLWIDKKTTYPYLLVVDGNKISHPRLVTGNRSRMKILLFDPKQDIPLHTVHTILSMAIALHNT